MMNSRTRTVVYISGKMSGLPDLGRSTFNYAEQMLRAGGFIVLNPAYLPEGMAYPQYMAIAIAMLQQANMVVMLPGWETSRGALAEKAYAESIGLPIMLFEDYQREYNAVARKIHTAYTEAV